MLIDLSHPITDAMPVWPGDPQVRLQPAAQVPTHGYNLLGLSLGSQTGTHVDAPFHVDSALPRLDEIPLDRFVGPAVVADLRELAADAAIRPEDLEPVRSRLRAGVVLLLCTGSSARWGDPGYARHPWLSPAAARWVLNTGVRTMGIDAPSIDPADDLTAHHLCAVEHAVIAENLTGLEALLPHARIPGTITVWLLPLALAGADGAPVRAVAQVRELG